MPYLVALGFALSAALGEDAAHLYKKAREAERAGKFDRAYVLYSQAALLDPNNHMYWLRSQAVRSRAALQAIPAEGTLPAQFAGEAPEVPTEPPGRRLETPTAAEMAEARKPQSPVELKAAGGRKDVDFSGDSRTLFERVSQAFGLDCVFDSDYQAGRSIRFRMEQVDYREALHGLQAATGSFIIPLTSKLFMVARDTPEKRRDLEPWISVALQVPQVTNPQELTQVVTAVQQALAIEKVGFDSQTNTVLLRGPASKIVPAQALFEDLVRQRAEVAVDVDIFELNRNDILTYGLALPNVFPLTAFNSAGNAVMTLADLARWGPGGTMFSVAIANAQLLAQFSNSQSNSLTHLELQSVDGQPVTFHAGDRYPVLTAGYYGQSNVNAGAGATNTGTSTNNSTSSVLQSANSFGDTASPTAVAVADFNRDGIQDFAATSSSGNQVAIYLGNGNGTFGNPSAYATGQNPSALLALDVNGDGITDLITADAASNTASVLLGVGDGTFQKATAFAVGTNPAAVATADFNQDGIPDIAVANADSNNITILLGRGDGTFQAGATVSAGTSPRALAAADFNGDGLADLAVANFSSNDLWILLNNGDGTFRKANTYTTGNSPRGLAASDVNRDSHTDLVVANSASNSVSVFLGDGTGAFSGGEQFAAGSGPVSLVIADFNNDALPDIAAANEADGTVSLLLGLGNGTFQTAINFAIGAGTEPVSIAHSDFNRDGYQDVLVANLAINDFSVLLASPFGGFQNPSGTAYQYTGGQTYTPPPAFTFEDLGLVVKATPHVHGGGEVLLELEAETKLLTGNTVNGVPEIAQRKLQSQVQLQTGEGAVVAGLLSTSDARSILGVAGLSTLPAIGPLLRKNNRDRSTSQVLIVITPRLLSLPPRDFPTHEVWVGSEARPRTPL